MPWNINLIHKIHISGVSIKITSCMYVSSIIYYMRYLMCIFKLAVQEDLFIQNIIIISFIVHYMIYRYKISNSITFWISRIKFEQFESVFITCVSIVPIPPPPAPGFLVLLSKQDSVTSGPDSRPRPANWKSQSVLRRRTAASYRNVCPYLAWGGRWPDAGTSPARAAAAWPRTC